MWQVQASGVGDQLVIVEKARDGLEAHSDAIRGFAAVGGPACRGRDDEVVAERIRNRLAGSRERVVEMAHCREDLVRIHVRGEPVLVAQIRFEEVDVAGIEGRVIVARFRRLLEGVAPGHTNRVWAPGHLGEAAQFPRRAIPIEIGAEDREISRVHTG